eukprot:CAMPEP_0201285598 /NCGR_PEP_ID=MMETSP1317-20130820/113562_1 /ASSEMBLY_ACC=CAM_ASM_000770 /TAXON_ID=187299 /ORGANISM="Undescribed Undescribed, Strain Undescribed" /LENGTH=143 /DNA_ID=CAMNT_0047611213 /DNA_START=820 /DNA_END=1248 /DNA_ORIENTATION=-
MQGSVVGRSTTTTVTIEVLPIPGEVWIDKAYDGETVSNQEILIYAAYAYKWLTKEERLDNLEWSLQLVNEDGSEHPIDIDDVTTGDSLGQMAIAIDTQELLEEGVADCDIDYCQFKLTLEGTNTWDDNDTEHQVQDSVTFKVW